MNSGVLKMKEDKSVHAKQERGGLLQRLVRAATRSVQDLGVED
jgi:hypothetical protein